MSDKTQVVDGADRRKQRLLELLRFLHTNNGATILEMKSFMTIRFGLRHETSAKYIQELHLAGLITQDGPKWHTTKRYTQLAKYLYT